MESSFRDTRIGITSAAKLLGVTVTAVKFAVQNESQINGVDIPKPLIRRGGHYQFIAGEIMDCVKAMERENRKH